ncbi:PolC-type DNA polymerase III [Maribacter chungangensis]|uniref:PolC-type DNA polymerase III n=1 Tax=Maribacter chungangensis TaxID=1069117 RepID=A0ABW3B5R4_9FLAO
MFTKKNYPDFWNKYAASFTNGLPKLVVDNTFVVLDTETTGFDIKEDRILSIGALVLHQNMIQPKQAFEVFLEQKHYDKSTAKIHGILRTGKQKRITELEGLQRTLKILENSVLVAHHTGYDVAMLNSALKRNGLPKLKNKTLDTSKLYFKTLGRIKQKESNRHSSLDDLAKMYDISKKDRHTALGDAYITAIAFLRILEKLKPVTLNELLRQDGPFKLW